MNPVAEENINFISACRKLFMEFPSKLHTARLNLAEKERLVESCRARMDAVDADLNDQVCNDPKNSNADKRKSAMEKARRADPTYLAAQKDLELAEVDIDMAKANLERVRDQRRSLEYSQNGSIEILQTIRFKEETC